MNSQSSSDAAINRSQYDVVVVGAGPAGSATAIQLAQLGLSVVVISAEQDQAALKVGESIPGATLRLLRSLGFSDISTMMPPTAFSHCVANASAWGTEHWHYQSALKNPEGGGWHIDRPAFEQALRSRAKQLGVCFISAVPKINTMNADSGVLVKLSYLKQASDVSAGIDVLRASYFIDATGKKAAIARSFGARRIRTQQQLALVAWLKPCAAIDTELNCFHDSDHCTRIKSVADGWWYTAKLPNGYRVISFFTLPKWASQYRHQSQAILSQFNQAGVLTFPVTANDLLQPFKVLNASSAYLSSCYFERGLAVGDAAYACDPLSSQGIYFSLYSGIQAAHAIAKSASGDKNAFSNYKQKVSAVISANERAKMYHYHSETRFNSEYWRSQKGLNNTEQVG